MKRKKLLKTLAEFWEKDKRKRGQHHAELEKLLNRLQEKEAQLKEEMVREEDARKQKRLGKKLEIIKAQHAKGIKTLQSLEES